VRVCRLPVEFCEGKGPGVGEEAVEVVYRVEDCYEVEEGGYETDGVLGENGFGNVGSRVGELFGEVGDAITNASVSSCLTLTLESSK
jgi:hypothetical protein